MANDEETKFEHRFLVLIVLRIDQFTARPFIGAET